MSELFRYRINGVIDTTRNVLENIEQLANACCTWVSYDNMTGEWAVVINKPGTSKRSFNDNNIIGDITLTTTSLNEFYNRVEVSFPHRDIDDAVDLVAFNLPAEQRFPNEQDNTLSITLDLVNEPVQAQAIGMIELKQNRQDHVVTFQTDFSNVDLQAGDIIDITNANFNWTNKPFRIVSLAETDSEEGIILDITALEYSDDVYDISDIERFSPAEEAIVTVGNIGRMSTPLAQINVSTGQIAITSQTPATSTGLVETVEFWVYNVPEGEDVPNVDDNTRIYRLMSAQRPPAGGGVFDAGENVTVVINDAMPNRYLFKARAKNSLALGGFSDYVDVMYEGAVIKDNNVNDLLVNGAIGPGSIYATLMALLSQQVGTPNVEEMLTGLKECQCGGVEIDADTVSITYQFYSGRDLDIRARLVYPEIPGNDGSVNTHYVGWSASSELTHNGLTLLSWGGDNTGTGAESVLVNVESIKLAFPGVQEIVVDCRAFWYGSKGAVAGISAKLFEGGSPYVSNYNWVNPSATLTKDLAATSAVVNTYTQSASTLGDRISFFYYNIGLQQGRFM